MEQVSAYNMRVGSLIKSTWNDELFIVKHINEEKIGDCTYKSHKLEALSDGSRCIITFTNGRNEFRTLFVISY